MGAQVLVIALCAVTAAARHVNKGDIVKVLVSSSYQEGATGELAYWGSKRAKGMYATSKLAKERRLARNYTPVPTGHHTYQIPSEEEGVVILPSEMENVEDVHLFTAVDGGRGFYA